MSLYRRLPSVEVLGRLDESWKACWENHVGRRSIFSSVVAAMLLSWEYSVCVDAGGLMVSYKNNRGREKRAAAQTSGFKSETGERKGTFVGSTWVISIVRSLIACVISRIILRVNSKF